LKPETISLIANICTIFSSFSIVVALFVYVRDKFIQNRKYDFSNKSKRTKNLKKITKKSKDIRKIVLSESYKKGAGLTEILLSKYRDYAQGDREKNLKNGLEFMLSKESIQGFNNFSPQIYNNFDDIMSRFFELVIDKKDYYTENSKRIDAWIPLKNVKQFVVKFPIPSELFNEKEFSDIRYSNKTITSLGDEILLKYFLPYLIFYISINYDKLEPDDAYTIFSVLWEIGLS